MQTKEVLYRIYLWMRSKDSSRTSRRPGSPRRNLQAGCPPSIPPRCEREPLTDVQPAYCPLTAVCSDRSGGWTWTGWYEIQEATRGHRNAPAARTNALSETSCGVHVTLTKSQEGYTATQATCQPRGNRRVSEQAMEPCAFSSSAVRNATLASRKIKQFRI